MQNTPIRIHMAEVYFVCSVGNIQHLSELSRFLLTSFLSDVLLNKVEFFHDLIVFF